MIAMIIMIIASIAMIIPMNTPGCCSIGPGVLSFTSSGCEYDIPVSCTVAVT